MFYTNLYLVYRKLKEEKFVGLPGVHKEDYDKPENIANKIINESIKTMALMPLVEDGIRQNACNQYIVIKNDANAEHMILRHYDGYIFLFFEYGDYSVLINYARDDTKMCYTGDVNTWEYLPNKEEKEFYRQITGTKYYMVNSFEAFCNYSRVYYPSEPLNRENNISFYKDAEEMILSNLYAHKKKYKTLDDFFTDSRSKLFIERKKDTEGRASFLYYVQDYLIILVDFKFEPGKV
ncbi:MAG: hypothetical protein K6E91_06245 [Butyrivibrio sp.]|nr:hypothetical protein [Butyrivibrio sp.]